MKRILKVLLPVGILVAGLLAARALLLLRPDVKPVTTEIPLPVVEVVEARRAAVELEVRAQGTVVPRTETRLVTEVSGSVLEVSPRWVNGGFFEQGEVLLRIDTTDYLLAEKEAEMRVARARLVLAQEEADAEIARQDWAIERGDEEPPELVVRGPQLAEATAALAAAGSALQRAHRDLERCAVVAPYPGRVPLSYRGEEEESSGPEVTLLSQFAGREFKWTGRVVRTEGELDPRSRMVIVVVQVDDPYGRSEMLDRPPLAIGMFVEALIAGRSVPDAVSLPRTALRAEGRVYVLEDEDVLRIEHVGILRTERDRILIRDGLEPGTRVIVSPLEEAVDGMTVRPLRKDSAR